MNSEQITNVTTMVMNLQCLLPIHFGFLRGKEKSHGLCLRGDIHRT